MQGVVLCQAQQPIPRKQHRAAVRDDELGIPGDADQNGIAGNCLLYTSLVKVGGNFLAMKGASGEEELTAARGAIKKLGGEYRRCV